MITDKIYFASEVEFNKYKKKYCRNSAYTKYFVGKPKKFPCVGIVTHTPEGDLGANISLEEFVYLSDFKEKTSSWKNW